MELVSAPAFHAAICAHEQRLPQAVQLLETIGGVLTLDDGTLGSTRNHIRAWEEAHESNTIGAEWIAVIEDDAVPVPWIHTVMQMVLDNAPCDIVSGYLGQGRPPEYQPRIREALGSGATWIVADELLHHVAVFVRTERVPSMIASLRDRPNFPCDEAVSLWACNNGLPVAYVVPSPFDHADTEPVICDASRAQPIREAVRLGGMGRLMLGRWVR
ncbi:hypothetical protein GS498_20450, partial [Rhodococcus hoagii]|nr:hypothetical protein [Prescottella equi]